VSAILDGDNYLILLRTSSGSERITVPSSSIPSNFFRKFLGLAPPVKAAIIKASSSIPFADLKCTKDPNLPNDLVKMEERQIIRSYKFGLCYVGPNQSTEEEMFSNNWESTSPGFRQFLNFLGERIELKGWKGYRAGLDVNSSLTGAHSYYTKWQGYEIMYHVSVLLPHTEENQQLER
jgi:RAP1 GTPase activating protein 1